jgi:hypothetical protein
LAWIGASSPLQAPQRERKESGRDPQHDRHRQVGLRNVPSKDRNICFVFGLIMESGSAIISGISFYVNLYVGLES